MGPPQRDRVENGSVPEETLIGRRVGPYQVLSQIGTGGMGEVYLARDTKLDRHVAVKLLAANVAADPIRLRRFHDEARTASALNHPNILVVHDFGTVDGRPYMVTEFVEGETVRARLERGPMAIQPAIDVALQVVSALAAAHGRGIVHRDIKPENVMLRPDGYVKVLDFGLAKLAAAPDTQTTDTLRRTLPGTVLGTPQYMSPEQARGLDLDARTDLWSLGVMLYEMIAGLAPFGRATAGDSIAAILREDPLPPRSAATLIPRSLERIVMKTLRKAREERWQSANELYAELGACKLELDLEAHKERTRPGGLARHTRERVKPRRQKVKALAVLPLQNLSGNPSDEYFSDGMTEALIASLAQLSALRVISRTSAMRYKGGGTPLADIARELGVDVIVEGSVLAMEGRVRITAQLIEAASDTLLWAKSYERELRDVLTLQNEVARSIVDEISLKVTPRERARLRRARQVNPEAYQLYLRGRFHWHKRNEENVRRAIAYFTQALAREPDYAAALVGLADSYLLLGFSLGLLPGGEWAATARASAERALRLDAELAGAHNTLAIAKLQQWDWSGADVELTAASELDPNDPVARNWHANCLAALGRFDEAVDAARRAIELDPLALTWNMGLGHMYYLARRYDEAIEQERKTLAMDPAFYMTHWILGLAYEQKGRLAESVAALEQAVTLSGSILMQGLLGRAYGIAGRLSDASDVLDDLSRRAGNTFVSRDALALVHAGLGAQDRAIDLLFQACDEPSFNLIFLKVSPVFDTLRSHPRFSALLRRANLEPST
jgi:serine/threonine protein kinase/Flp pilus assembly protein TadD